MSREDFSVGQLTLKGIPLYKGAQDIYVLARDSAGDILIAKGLVAPTDSNAGFAKGALFIDTNVAAGTSGLYQNVGTNLLCNFDRVDSTITAANIPLATGSLLIGVAGVAAAIDGKADAKILIGNGTTMAAQSLGTDVTMTNTGAVTIANNAITTGKILNDAVTTAKILDANVTSAKLAVGVFTNTFATRFTNPALAVDDRYFALADMTAAAMAVANASPTDSLCRNVTVTHADGGGVTDTLGDLVVDGTNYLDEVIQETITLVANSVVSGTKAFKTVTGLQTASWVVDAAPATADQIKVGFGDKLGMSFVKNSASAFVAAGLGTGLLMAPTIAVGATIELMTVDLSGGTYDGAKDGFVLFNS